MLCKYERCKYYLQEPHPKIGKKCYYGEPGCILGYIDKLIETVEISIQYRMKKLRI